MKNPFTKPRYAHWLIAFGIWTFVGVFFGIQTNFTLMSYGLNFPLFGSLSWFMLFFYKWFFFSPLIFAQARRWPLERGKILNRVPIHFLFVIGFHFISTPLWSALHFVLACRPIEGSTTHISTYMIGETIHPYTFTLNFFTYWVVLIVGWSLDYQKRFRESEMNLATLSRQLAEAQLRALKMQLQPHFLFNTLHSITSLLHEDAEAADKMTVRLGNFLRMTLDHDGKETTTLEEELKFVQLYLDIEKVRFNDRLCVTIDIDNTPNLIKARVPSMILQPLIENAIHHGISKRCKPASIHIYAHSQNERLHIQISDTGPGITSCLTSNEIISLSLLPNEGIGISNTRARLEQLYSNDFNLTFRANLPQGLIVAIEIPFICTHKYEYAS